MTGALAGLTVIDLTRVLAGPYCTQLLADHGARVIKVEPPNGDPTRNWGPPQTGDISAYYAGLNRNKDHLCVDLSHPDGQDLLRRLLATADVVVENFKPATMEGWGLAPDALMCEFPALVYCRITAFGSTGPMGGLPGLDAVMQAYCGIMDMNGEPDGLPIRIPMPIVDLSTAMLAFSGILLALHERNASGRGQLVDLSLMDSAVSLLHPAAANYFMGGSVPRRLGTAHPNIAPSESFPGPDGPIYVAGGTDEQFRILCSYLGHAALADDPRFCTNSDRVRHRAELTAALGQLLDVAQVGRSGSLELLAAGVPVSLVRRLDTVLADPQVAEREMVQELDGFRMLGIPIKLGRTPGSIRRPPATRGRDSVAVLREYGMPEEMIEELTAAGVVYEPDPEAAGLQA
ncbi:CoA transferase [Jatrophihabitans sp.]|uniref:CaiB/BaiF CoA transferase family protein n=1 Tax=Jatrophihabitans sp. TaxID=1932789 RepID=UPI0030C756BD